MCASKMIPIKRWIQLIFICLWQLCSCGAFEPKELSFELLSQWNSAWAANLSQPEAFALYNDSQVEIRGFIYAIPDGTWILAAVPNLKSCCLGHGQQFGNQLQVSWRIPPDRSDAAVLIRGTLHLDHNSPNSRAYRLDDATVVTLTPTTTFWHYLLLLLIFAFICFYYLRKLDFVQF